MDTSPLITRITRLEDEVEVLRKERDRFRRIASNAEEQTAKRRIEYLTLEGEYEEERRKRLNAVCNESPFFVFFCCFFEGNLFADIYLYRKDFLTL